MHILNSQLILKVEKPADLQLLEGQPVSVDSAGRIVAAKEGDTVIGTVAMLHCKHCGETREAHVNGKCLFEATTYAEDASPTIEVVQLPQHMGPYILRNGVPTVDVGPDILKGATVTVTEADETADFNADAEIAENIGRAHYWRLETKGKP